MAKRRPKTTPESDSGSPAPAPRPVRMPTQFDQIRSVLEGIDEGREPSISDVVEILRHLTEAAEATSDQIDGVTEQVEELHSMWGDPYELPKQMGEVTDALDEIKGSVGGVAARPATPAAKGKRRKKKSEPSIVIGCGGLFLLVVAGLILWGAWKSITGTP